jgi:hypothetical protein
MQGAGVLGCRGAQAGGTVLGCRGGTCRGQGC